MRVLITSGGTIVKIDDVRHIGNFSTGSFPAKIANAAIARGHEVIYLHAKKAMTPIAKRHVRLISYETYDDYARELEKILKNTRIDVVFLGAAVSDYGAKQYKGKISSSRQSLTIHLFRLPKIIRLVKSWSRTPLFQVGFKLLSNATERELIEIAYKSGLENRSDLTIANDLLKIRSREPETILVTPEKGAIKLKGSDLAKKIIEFVERRAMAVHFKTIVRSKNITGEKYNKEKALFRKLCSRLNKCGLMPDFFAGATSGHGSLALRIGGNSFLITARGSNKKNLRPDDIVLVRKVDWKKMKIIVESAKNKKASLNAILVSAILEKFPDISAVVHTHSFIKKAPTTTFPNTPGTLEYAIESAGLFRKNIKVINLKNHGLVAIGSDLKTTTNYVLR